MKSIKTEVDENGPAEVEVIRRGTCAACCRCFYMTCGLCWNDCGQSFQECGEWWTPIIKNRKYQIRFLISSLIFISWILTLGFGLGFRNQIPIPAFWFMTLWLPIAIWFSSELALTIYACYLLYKTYQEKSWKIMCREGKILLYPFVLWTYCVSAAIICGIFSHIEFRYTMILVYIVPGTFVIGVLIILFCHSCWTCCKENIEQYR